MASLLTTPRLVASIELSVAEDLRACAETGRDCGEYPEAEFLPSASGGGALWMGGRCPINGAAGMGMAGPATDEEMDALTAFFADRGEPARVDVCPLAHPTLLEGLAARGFAAAGFESQLARTLSPADEFPQPAEGVEVREATAPDERALWGTLAATGFADGVPTEEDLRVGRAMSHRRDARLFIGYLEGEPAGTGLLVGYSEMVSLNADATLPAARGRGVQSALLAHRLSAASRSGYRLARIEAVPGTSSHRNQERLGFRTLYTRVTLSCARALPKR